MVLAAGPVRAEDLEAGKSGPKIFEADCSGCHHSAKGLAKGQGARAVADFLRSHYTTGPGPASSVAEYLVSMGASGRGTKPGTVSVEPASPHADKPTRQPPQDGRGSSPESRRHQRTTPDHAAPAEPAEQGVLSGSSPGPRRPRSAPSDHAGHTSPPSDAEPARAGVQSGEPGSQNDRKRQGPGLNPQDGSPESASIPVRQDGQRSNGNPPAAAPESADRHPDSATEADANARSPQVRPAAGIGVPEPEVAPQAKAGANGAGIARGGAPAESVSAGSPADENAAATAAPFPDVIGSRGSLSDPAAPPGGASPSSDQATFSAPLP